MLSAPAGARSVEPATVCRILPVNLAPCNATPRGTIDPGAPDVHLPALIIRLRDLEGEGELYARCDKEAAYCQTDGRYEVRTRRARQRQCRRTGGTCRCPLLRPHRPYCERGNAPNAPGRLRLGVILATPDDTVADVAPDSKGRALELSAQRSYGVFPSHSDCSRVASLAGSEARPGSILVDFAVALPGLQKKKS